LQALHKELSLAEIDLDKGKPSRFNMHEITERAINQMHRYRNALIHIHKADDDQKLLSKQGLPVQACINYYPRMETLNFQLSIK